MRFAWIFKFFTIFYNNDLYKAMMSSLVVSFRFPGLQASAIAYSARKSRSSSLTSPFNVVEIPTSIKNCLVASIAALL